MLCIRCGRIGHITTNCPTKLTSIATTLQFNTNSLSKESERKELQDPDSEWKTVTFPKLPPKSMVHKHTSVTRSKDTPPSTSTTSSKEHLLRNSPMQGTIEDPKGTNSPNTLANQLITALPK